MPAPPRPSLLSRVRARVIGRQVTVRGRALDLERCPGSAMLVHEPHARFVVCPYCGEETRVTDGHRFYAHDWAGERP